MQSLCAVVGIETIFDGNLNVAMLLIKWAKIVCVHVRTANGVDSIPVCLDTDANTMGFICEPTEITIRVYYGFYDIGYVRKTRYSSVNTALT